ncbi:MAG: phospholipid-binding protein MlaC [Geminicoccaceae bacterium]
MAIMQRLSRRVTLALAVAIPATTMARGATTEEAGAFVDGLGQQTIAALDRIGKDADARQQAISDLLNEAVDLERISRLCLGRHWRTASEAQREEYVRLFRDNVLAVLSRRMSHYTGGEKFVVTATRPAGEDAMVASQIIYASNDPPLKIEWRVRVENGSPMIIDVLPEGVSLVLTYRSEFDEVISRNGLDGLLTELRNRAAKNA